MGTVENPRIRVHRERGPLGQWTVAVATAPPDLADCIETTWFGAGRVSYQRDRILPTGSSHLLINLGPVQYLLDAESPGGRRRFEDIWFSAPQQGPIDTEAPHGQALLGIAFRPDGARRWLGVPACELTGRIHALEDLIGPQARSLREQLLAEPDPARRIGLAEAWLRQRCRAQPGTPLLVRRAVDALARSRGQVGIEQIADRLGCSRIYLARLFQQHVGLSAKSLARLHRFQDALRLLRERERVPWVELAAVCGYYDQSHLSRDFRAFSGFAPGEFARLARPDASSVVLQ